MIYFPISFALYHSFHGLYAIITDYIHEKSLCAFLIHCCLSFHFLAFLTFIAI